MALLKWDETGAREYETGVRQGVLYPYDSSAQDPTKAYGPGVAWNGLSSISESPEGAEANDIYADDIKYLSLISAEKFGATIEAYTYPDEFAKLDGSATLGGLAGVMVGQQSRGTFGLCYRTVHGNDVDGEDFAYKLHLVYGCKAAPSEKGYQTINDSPEAITFSWEINTTPVNVGTVNGIPYKPTATITIDSADFKTETLAARLANLEKALFGTDTEGQTPGTDPYLPLPAEVYAILSGTAG